MGEDTNSWKLLENLNSAPGLISVTIVTWYTQHAWPRQCLILPRGQFLIRFFMIWRGCEVNSGDLWWPPYPPGDKEENASNLGGVGGVVFEKSAFFYVTPCNELEFGWETRHYGATGSINFNSFLAGCSFKLEKFSGELNSIFLDWRIELNFFSLGSTNSLKTEFLKKYGHLALSKLWLHIIHLMTFDCQIDWMIPRKNNIDDP